MSRTMQAARRRETWRQAVSSLLVAACWPVVLLGATGCAAVQVHRLNPGEAPERFRVVCRDSSRHCKRKARDVCDGEYVVISQDMTEPELEEVQTTGVSSTGPSEGLVGWRGELVIACGRELPPLELKRAEGAPAASGSVESAAEAAAIPPPRIERICVPGAMQACLGPGACSGAQACLEDASGYGACDCGTNPPAAVAPTASASPGPPRAAPSSAPSGTAPSLSGTAR